MADMLADALTHAREQGISLTVATALLGHLTGRSRAWLLTHPEARLPMCARMDYHALLARAAAGEPLAYLTGEWAFYDLTFTVTPDVLVPRPETEHLVEQALEWTAGRSAIRAVDVGTGSGVIAITLAAHLPTAQVIALDVSRQALRVARLNAIRHGVLGRVRLVQTDLLRGVVGPFDLIVANLPYVRTVELMEGAYWEPRLALDGGSSGLQMICALLYQAPPLLASRGLMVLEIGADQGQAVAALARRILPDAQVAVMTDLAGLDRVVRIQTQ